MKDITKKESFLKFQNENPVSAQNEVTKDKNKNNTNTKNNKNNNKTNNTKNNNGNNIKSNTKSEDVNFVLSENEPIHLLCVKPPSAALNDISWNTRFADFFNLSFRVRIQYFEKKGEQVFFAFRDQSDFEKCKNGMYLLKLLYSFTSFLPYLLSFLFFLSFFFSFLFSFCPSYFNKI